MLLTLNDATFLQQPQLKAEKSVLFCFVLIKIALGLSLKITMKTEIAQKRKWKYQQTSALSTFSSSMTTEQVSQDHEVQSYKCQKCPSLEPTTVLAVVTTVPNSAIGNHYKKYLFYKRKKQLCNPEIVMQVKNHSNSKQV